MLLIGGDKTGNPKWYQQVVPVADRLFDEHLAQLKKERWQNVAKKFNELRATMSAESRARSHAKAEQYRKDMALDELREAQNLAQEHLAKVLNVKQSAISKMERRTDVYVSTLQSFVRAMGGELRIEVVFPEGGRVEINQFRRARKAAAAS